MVEMGMEVGGELGGEREERRGARLWAEMKELWLSLAPELSKVL